jgi:hypothetical protein
MKPSAAALAILAPALVECGRLRPGENAFIQHLYSYGNATAAIASGSKFGNSDCPCVGIDNIEGSTEIDYNSKHYSYPADVGASCSAWESASHPDCKGDKAPEWCSKAWCYVDPCNCKGLAVPPKPSDYMKEAKFQGKPIHYSYVTCGSTDVWSTDEKKLAAQKAENKELCALKVDEAHWGNDKCRCIGIDGQEGKTEMEYEGKEFSYPADVGARCDDWEHDNHPECKGDKAPDWCSQKWCYVDPCSCDLSTPSKPTQFLKHASFQAKMFREL